MPKTFQFLAPSLHPNTLTDLAIPEAGPSTLEPIVKHLPIRYGQHQPIGLIKRIVQNNEHEITVVDDAFRLSTLSLGSESDDSTQPPAVTRQVSASAKTGSVWAGLVPVQGGTIGAPSSGAAHFVPSAASPDDAAVARADRKADLPGPLTCIASSSASAPFFAAAGKEVDVSIWDIERAFASEKAMGTGEKTAKRKKTELREGEIWQAKNLAHDSLNLRPPIHHLALTYAPDSSTSLVSGTKSGSVRRYDTRQRKPVSDWKLAREGGVGAVSFGEGEHELFYADRASLLAALDLRMGKMLYTIPSTCTVHHLVSFPGSVDVSATSRRIGLVGVSSDATLRLYGTTPIPEEGVKGNWGGEGKKGAVVGMVGGVGVGGFVWRGFGQVDANKSERTNGIGAEDQDSEEEEEEVWEGMDEVGEADAEAGDHGSDEDVSSDGEHDVDPPVKRKRRVLNKRRK